MSGALSHRAIFGAGDRPGCLTCLSCERALFHSTGRCSNRKAPDYDKEVGELNACPLHEPLTGLGTQYRQPAGSPAGGGVVDLPPAQPGVKLGAVPAGALVRCEPCAHLPGHFSLSGLGLAVTVEAAVVDAIRTAIDGVLPRIDGGAA